MLSTENQRPEGKENPRRTEDTSECGTSAPDPPRGSNACCKEVFEVGDIAQ